jgi:hypothetical protein
MSTRTRSRVITPRRIVYAAMLTVAAVAFVAAFLIHPEPTKPARPPGVVAVSPAEGAKDVRQTTVSAELAAGYDGELTDIAGRVIPKDQVDRLQTGGLRLSFTPGPDKAFTSLPAGRVCATVRFWPQAEGEQTAQNYSWCFQLT